MMTTIPRLLLAATFLASADAFGYIIPPETTTTAAPPVEEALEAEDVFFEMIAPTATWLGSYSYSYAESYSYLYAESYSYSYALSYYEVVREQDLPTDLPTAGPTADPSAGPCLLYTSPSPRD